MPIKPKVEAGLLFDAHTVFTTITGSRYDNMVKRLAKKELGKPPFSKDELRADVLAVLNGHEDGATECRYCHGFYTVAEIAIDHAVPLSRGGGLGLDNLDYPCANCNNAKGSLTPGEFSKLVQFLESEIPLGRKDVLGRLAKAVSLAQGMRSNMGVIGDLKKQGTWQAAQAARRKKKSDALGPF